MKNISVIVSAFITFLFFSFFQITAISQSSDRSNFDYWLNKMEDPNQNYYQLVQEFENYWKYKDKTNVKGTGYKQFKRWQEAMSGMAGPDGKILPASYFSNQISNFKQSYGNKGIVGDWDFLGPDLTPVYPPDGSKRGIGRIACIAFHPTDPNTIFVGSHSGGIWKTTTGGNSWSNLNTDNLVSFGVSSIAIQSTNPDVIYLGTGDRDAGSVPGRGVWKTTDGGLTWDQLSSDMDDLLVSKVLIQPNWTEVILAGTKEGIYKSSDGGITWTKTTNVIYDVTDMAYKPGDPDIVYATGWGNFYRSDDAGDSWVQIYNNMPTGGRCVIGVTPANPEKVYYFATDNSKFEGFYISDDSGLNFAKNTSSAFDLQKQGWFNCAIAVDPTNEDIIFTGMIQVFKSIDGGNTWELLGSGPTYHDDQHALEFSPHTNELYIGCDGGLYSTNDQGTNFDNLNDGLAITQVARLAVSETNPDVFLAGLQDNGTITPVNGVFNRVTFNDGMCCEIDYTDDQYMYSSWQNNHIYRNTTGNTWSGNWENISVPITESAGWFRPYILDHNDPNIMYAGNINVWKSTNIKTVNANDVSWENISDGKFNDDLVIYLIEQSAANINIVYISKKNGARLYRTDSVHAANPEWQQFNNPPAGDYGKVECIETHPTDPNVVYIVTERNVFKSNDKGSNWVSIKNNLPDIPMKCIAYHQGSNEGLYVGTLAGVYYKDDDMPDWVQFKTGLPLVPVIDMKIIYSTDPDKLVAGTWGRGVWSTDVLPIMKPNLFINAATANVTDTDVEINVGLYNDSEMNDADSYVVGYYLSVNSYISIDDKKIGEDTILSHPHSVIIGESINVDVRFVEPEIPPGTYFIGAYADIYENISEINETDNSFTCTTQITVPDPPDSPINVQATDGTNISKVVITWDAPSSTYDLYYRVYRGLNSNQYLAQPLGDEWIIATTYDDFTTIPGTTYYYWVKAADNNLGLRSSPLGFSGWNSGWAALQAPIYCNATKGQFDDHIKIAWNPPSGGTHFMVYQNTVPDAASATPLYTTWITESFYEDYDVVFGTEYYYWAKSAVNNVGYRACSGWSNGTSGYLALVGAPDPLASDGTITDGIDISWNSIEGATHYMLFSNTAQDTSTATSVTSWITDTTWLDGTVDWGMYYYYWVKAAVDQNGANPSGYGVCDSGWRRYYLAENIIASDGTSTDHVEITWDNTNLLGYYRIYRSKSPSIIMSQPITNWEEHVSGVPQNHFDTTAISGQTYYYRVKISDDPTGEYTSGLSSSNVGWRKLYAPVCQVTQGVFSDKIQITWDSVPGAGAYRILKNEIPVIPENPLIDWSSTLDFQYDDFDVNISQTYYYFVQAAINDLGDRPSYFCSSYGFAEKCGNLKEDEAFRSVDLYGTNLIIVGRIYNEGPWEIQNPFEIAFTLQADTATTYDYLLGQKPISPLDVGEYFDFEFQVDISTIPGGPLPYGTWYIGYILPWDDSNCQTNNTDDIGVWGDMPFDYTDALYGTYTIGTGFLTDYTSFSDALSDLTNKGISDDVTFNVWPGTYYEQISIPPINSSRPEHSITFQSDPVFADTAEIIFTSNTDNYTIKFDGCSYITFQNLKISSPGYTNNVSTYGKVISFINDAHHISVLNNKISGTADFSFNSTDNCVIYYDNSPCHDLVINDNEILNGSYGIYFHGVSEGVNLSTGVWIENNVIKNFNHMGITLKYQQSPVIYNNTIYYASTYLTQCYGINLENIEDGFDIRNNKITMEPCSQINIGMNLQHCTGSIGNKGIVGNNFIAMISVANPIYGLIIYNVSETDILYNSINITGDINPDNFCINVTCTGGFAEDYNNRLINNIFANETNGNCILYSDIAILDDYLTECDFNDYYFTGTSIGQYGYGNNIPDLSSWVTVSGFDNNSLNIDPEFFSVTNLHTLSYDLDGVACPQSSIIDDIDLEARDALNPDIGADEFTPPPIVYDLKLYEFLAPTSGSSLGSEELITVYITNEGTEDLWDAPVNYSINGEAPVYEVITEIIFAGGEYEYTFTNTADLSQPGLYEIVASINHPDDQFLGNNSDTLIVEHYHPDLCVDNLYVYGCFYFFTYYQITDFSLNTINHLETGCSDNAYGDFTFLSTDLEQNGSYTMEVKLSNSYMYISMWIDLNDDYIFDPSEIFVNGLYCPTPNTTYSSTVNIPASAQTGQHRMRIRAVNNENNPDPCTQYNFGEVHDYTVNIINEVVQEFDLDLKVYLHGPFNGSEMNTDLNSILPLSQPYNTSPWNYLGNETTALIPNPNIVDWVLIEFRDAPDAASAHSGTMVTQQAAFLKNDGSVVEIDGFSNPTFNGTISHQLFVVIWHRNHLGIMSAYSVSELYGIYSYDFTTPVGQAYGTNAQQNLGSAYGMYAADGNANGTIDEFDISDTWATDAGNSGYLNGDFNMNGQTDNIDKNDVWLPNDGIGSQVP